MSLITELESKIVARAQSDGTLCSLLGGVGAPRFTNIWGPLTLTDAYVVFRAEETDVIDAFDKRASNFEVEFHVFDAASNGNTTCQAILVRLLGDWPAQANRQPTFGFDRWTPDLSTAGWNAGGGMVKVGSATAHEKDEFHYIMNLRGTASFL